MNVKAIMTDGVEALSIEDTALKASRLMKKYDIGCLPVLDTNSEVIGMVTDRDIVVRVFADILPMNTKVKSFMTSPVICVNETDEVGMTITKMSEYQVRRLPVIDRNNTLVGMVSLSDLALSQLTDSRSHVVLKSVSEPSHSSAIEADVDDFPL